MVDILHRVGIEGSSTAEVYDALTTAEGIAGWWTRDTRGSGEPGGVLELRFPPVGGFDLEVLEARPGEKVTWRVADGPDEWIGTTIDWDLQQDGAWTIVSFAHRGWREPVAFLHHCSTKWATFLLSLKSLAEDGTGRPAPDDQRISDWH